MGARIEIDVKLMTAQAKRDLADLLSGKSQGGMAQLFGNVRGANFASFGGDEFPIDKYVRAFGASQRQQAQAMRELKPALAQYKREMTEGLAEMKWNFPSLGFSGKPPPIIPPPIIPKGIDWKQAGMGAAVGGFNPWIGARMLSGSGVFGMGGGGAAGGLGGLIGAGGMAGFAGAFIALKVAAEAVRFAFTELVEAVQKGAKLFEDSAKLGVAPGGVARLQRDLEAIGISGSQANQLALRGQFPMSSKGTSANVAGETLRSFRGIGALGEVQQVQNMAKYMDEFDKSEQSAFRQMGNMSKPLFEFTFELRKLKTEWDTAWQGMAVEVSIVLKPVVEAITFELKLWNAEIEMIVRGLQFLHIVPRGTLDGMQHGGAAGGSGSMYKPLQGHYEHMGLIIGGGHGVGVEYAKQTANNTAKIATKLDLLAQRLAAGVKGAENMNAYGNSP